VRRDTGGDDVVARVAAAAAPRPDLDEPLHCPPPQQQQRRSRCRTTKPRAQRSRSAALCFVQRIRMCGGSLILWAHLRALLPLGLDASCLLEFAMLRLLVPSCELKALLYKNVRHECQRGQQTAHTTRTRAKKKKAK
jgi:hypothetical protein